MLLRTAIFASVAVIAATQVPRFYEMLTKPPAGQVSNESSTSGGGAGTKRPVQAAALSPGRVSLKADGRGHFSGSFRMNGKPVEGLVDTGASTIAINESTARRIGFAASGLDFRYKVNTANGGTEAARIILDRVEIGSLRVRDVEAFVLRDKALSGTLVGMSFLGRLKSYQVQDGGLTLVQ